MADLDPLLTTLHPLREPPAIDSIMPFVAMAVVGVLAALVVVQVARLLSAGRHRIRRAALRELAASRSLPSDERLSAQALLLRRLVRTIDGEAEARRDGAAWLTILDRFFATRFFSEGKGSVYGGGLYQRGAARDIDDLDRSLAGFIAKVRRS